MEEKCLVMWLNITLNEESFKLNSHTVKCLTLVSRYFANTLKNYIQQNYWFDLSSSKSGRRLTHYTPTNQKYVMALNEIMPSTKKVVFYYNFNNEVDNLLPPHITQIKFGFYFNQKIDHLPLCLTNLTFGWFFNQCIDNLPPNLKILEVGYRFNTRIQSLPPTVKQVTFGSIFKHPVDHLSNQIRFQRKVYDYHKGVFVITSYQYTP